MKQILWLVTIVFLSVSCATDKELKITQSAESKSRAELLIVDAVRAVLNVVPQYVATGMSPSSTVTMTSNVLLSDSTYPKVITLNYGLEDQVDGFGNNKRGKVLVTISSVNTLKGSFNIEFDNYYNNGSRLLGLLKADYSEVTSQPLYSILMSDSVRYTNANGTGSWNGTLSLLRTSGDNTIDVLDDVYSYEEDTKGQDVEAKTFTSKNEGSVTLDFSCKWLITSGMFEISPTDESPKLLKSNEQCDGVFEVGREGESPVYFEL